MGVTHHRTLWSPDFPPRHVPGWPALPIDCSLDFTQPPRAPRRSSRPPRTLTSSYGASRRSTSNVVGPPGSSLMIEGVHHTRFEVPLAAGSDSRPSAFCPQLDRHSVQVSMGRGWRFLVRVFLGIRGPCRFLGGFLESLVLPGAILLPVLDLGKFLLSPVVLVQLTALEKRS